MRRLFAAYVLALGIAVTPTCAQSGPISAVATVAERPDAVTIRPSGDAAFRPFVGRVEPLRPGDCVRAAGWGVAYVRYRGGARRRVEGGQHCVPAVEPAPSLPERARDAAVGAFRALVAVFNPPQGGPTNLIAKGTGERATTAPTPVWVLPDRGAWGATSVRPEVLWFLPSGDDVGRVEVRYRGGAVEDGRCRAVGAVVASGPSSGGRAPFPASARPLQRGRTYAVELVERGRTVDVGCVDVATEAEAEAAGRRERDLRASFGPGPSEPDGDPAPVVFRAVQLWDDGYVADAVALLNADGRALSFQVLDQMLGHVGPFTPTP